MNISVAIIPMAKAFGWSPTVAGLVQSSFFWGYMVSQIPGGYVNSRYGGRTVLPIGVGLWSGATAAVPVLAGTIPGARPCEAFLRLPALILIARCMQPIRAPGVWTPALSVATVYHCSDRFQTVVTSPIALCWHVADSAVCGCHSRPVPVAGHGGAG